jgi:rSAM/selenodomain-associated transferase 1
MLPDLTSQECLTLHLSLLKDTLFKVRSFSSVLYLAGSGYLPFSPEIPVRKQTGVDLGERMMNAFHTELLDHRKVVIIGTDSPTVPTEQITAAFAALDRNELVLGPCSDGGYYLIGLKKLVPEIFRDIPWGTGDVLTRTLERISNHSHFLLNSYFDVDFPADLIRLRQELDTPNHNLPNLEKWMEDYFGGSAK